MSGPKDKIDLTGQVFGCLTVLFDSGHRARGGVIWTTRCVCGAVKNVLSNSLRSGNTKGCGSCGRKTHGHASKGNRSRAYQAWMNAKQRCYNPANPKYLDYGGRGIVMCEQWQESFEVFLADMGEPPVGLTLDREDNDGPYSPDNCRWATRKQQMRNTRVNRYLTLDGETKIITEWAEQYGLTAPTIYHRLEDGWPLERALTEPSATGGRNG